ncbi:MAG TPA: cytochrome D1 domain-containing protein [Gemmatimonadales bacterium]|jgi:DNA-binding beta-propeller fold protein YncE|nr:cytochrome D1 domain-containing protein [Gemmatimonadales bacterium]
MRLLSAIALLTGFVQPVSPGYRILVASESGDIVTELVWDGTALAVAKVVPVGVMPADIDGPHNVSIAPDGSAWYVTIAHGTPYGSLWKMAAGSDSLLGRAQLEMFPTTIALTPDGALAFVANSDFHGDHPRVNVVTIVQTASMTPLTNLPACDMPHGVKVNHAGTRVYVSCMDSDEILEIDRQTFRIRRRHKTGAGMGHATMGASGPVIHGSNTTSPAAPDCSPTFVSVSPDDRRLYVACNHGNTLQVLDAVSLELVREIPVGAGAYNVEPSADGRWVIVTNKKAQSVSLVEAHTLTEVAKIPTSKSLPHGVAYSPDGRWAFVSQESVGVDPGAVDVIDLTTRTRVASIAVPRQPTGITILPHP